MEHTGIVIGKESWAVLREEPLYSARFIDREGTEELAVIVRVEAIDWFFEVQPLLTLDLTGDPAQTPTAGGLSGDSLERGLP